MTKDIVEKPKLSLFELWDKIMEEQQNRFKKIKEQMDMSIFNMYNFDKSPVIKMGNLEEFQKSIEDFKKLYPEAKINARAYTFSSSNPEQNKIFEFNDEKKALPEKKKIKKIKGKKTKKNSL